jgi:hypothetical protein
MVAVLSLAAPNAARAQACIDNAASHTIGIIAVAGNFYTYNPHLSLPSGTYRFICDTTAGLPIQNVYLSVDGNGWNQGQAIPINTSPNTLVFGFNVPVVKPVCSSAIISFKLQQRVGVWWHWSTVCRFDLKVVVAEPGEPKNMTFVNGISKAYYVGSDSKAHVMTWNTNRWDYAAVNVTAGWGSVEMDGHMASFSDGSRIFFRSKNKKLFNLVPAGSSWALSLVGTTLPDVQGDIVARNNNEVAFVGSDKQLHQLIFSGTSWSDQIVVPTGGWGVTGVPEADKLALPLNSTDIFFSRNGSLGRVYKVGGSWSFEKISPFGTCDSAVLAVEDNAVYYKGLDYFIHRYVKVAGAWSYDAMVVSPASQNNVIVRAGYFSKFPGEDRIFYKAANGKVYNIYRQGSAWVNYVLDDGMDTAAGDLIAAEGKIFYINHEKRVHNFYWNGSKWVDVRLSESSQADTKGCILSYYD